MSRWAVPRGGARSDPPMHLQIPEGRSAELACGMMRIAMRAQSHEVFRTRTFEIAAGIAKKLRLGCVPNPHPSPNGLGGC